MDDDGLGVFKFELDEQDVTIISDESDDDSVQIISSTDDHDTASMGSDDLVEVVEISEETVRQAYGQPKLSRDDFDILSTIGTGGYAHVYLARKKTGQDHGTICALKVLKKAKIIRSAKEIEHTKAERNILESIKHPFIVQLLYAFQSEGSLYLGLEFMCGGELFNYLKNEHFFCEDAARFYTCEILLALEHLHLHGIIYRDLKPENILLDALGHIKLTDFGLSKENLRDGQKTGTFCGTIDYMAPEMLTSSGHNKAVDIWSLGILLFDMLNGDPPFKSMNKREAIEKIAKFRVKFKPFITKNAQDLIRKLLKKQAHQRLGCGPDGAHAIKMHRFFETINWDDVIQKKLEPPFKPHIRSLTDVSNFDKKFTRMKPEESLEDTRQNDSDNLMFKDFSFPKESNFEGMDVVMQNYPKVNNFEEINVHMQNYCLHPFNQNQEDTEIVDIS